MSTKKDGHLVTEPEWRKHLRSAGKKRFWKRERQAEKKLRQSLRKNSLIYM